MSALLCCAYLRVYRPIEYLSETEREHVEQVVRDVDRPARAHPLSLLAPDECRDAYVLTVDDRMYVCPAQTRLRTILGMLAFERAVPPGAGSMFFSESEMNEARRELEVMQSAGPDLRPCIVQSAWHVPLRWFVCFEDTERRIEHDGEHARIRYQTTVEAARRRVEHALDTLKGGIVHPVIMGMLFELKEWLATFGDDSILELDYASVATLFDAEELADDHSVAEVWRAIRALGEGDGMSAGLYYRRANERWMRARQRQELN